MKKFREIVSDMASWILLNGSKVTNFSVGSVVRTLIEAIAIEIEQLYFFIASRFQDLQDGAIYTSFGFSRKPALPATGIVTVTFIQPLTQSVLFAKGYKFYTQPLDGKTIYFVSSQDTTANIGVSSVDIPIECTEAGTIGNVPAYSITRVVNSTPFVANIVNNQRFFTGAPQETKEERQKRFNSFVDSLGKGTNDAVIYGCMQVDGIAGVKINEGIGMISIYAHDAYGNLSDTLKSAIEDKLYDYKTGGIKAIVTGVVKKAVDINVQVLINSGYDKDTILYKVQDTIEVYLNKLTVSKSLIKADLIRSIMDIDREGIENISLSLASDVIVQPEELIRPGIITVTEMG